MPLDLVFKFKGTVDTAAYFLTANLNVNFGIGLIVSPDVAGNLRGLGIGAYYKISDKTDGEAVYHIKDGALYADLKATTDGKRYEPLTIDLVNI